MALRVPHVMMMSHETPVGYIPETLEMLPRGTQSVITVQEERVVPPGQVLHVSALVDPATGRRLSLQQAAASGLLDVTAGRFTHPTTDRRLSLTDAAQQGWIDAGLLQQLQQTCGMRDANTGSELSIMDAMKKRLIDPITAEITDPRNGRKMTLQEAVDERVLSRDAASALSYICITTSFTSRTHGFYGVGGLKDAGVTLTLADALEKGLYNARTGKFVDPVSKEELTLQDAIRRGLLDSYAKDVVHPVTGERLSVEDAISLGVLDAISGDYVDPKSGRRTTLDEAASRSLVLKPISFREALTEGLLDESGWIRDARSGRRLPLTDAVDQGVLDADIKCILDPGTRELLSLEEATERGVISTRGQYLHPTRSGQPMSIQVP